VNGVTGYNLKNKERARALLKEAGYAGQPVRTRDLKGFQGNPFLHFWNAWLAR
jgi:hypothetical protein